MRPLPKTVIAFLSAAQIGITLVVPGFSQNTDQYRRAPQEVDDANGGMFMQEVQTSPDGRPTKPRVNVWRSQEAPHQEIRNNLGSDFMEEVTEPTPRSEARIPIDLRNAGVQVDSKGQIVPMLNRNAPPVQFQYNSGLQAYREMPVPTIAPTYNNPLGLPYDVYGRPAAAGTAFVPVTPGTIPGIRSMNIPPAYYYGNRFGYGPGYGFGYMPWRQTQYQGTYSETSLTGDSAGLIMPMFRNFDR